MKICPRCYKELDTVGINYPPVEYHTCSPKVTKCCGEGAVIANGREMFDPVNSDIKPFKVERGNTYYYRCKKCGQACDLIYGVKDEIQS